MKVLTIALTFLALFITTPFFAGCQATEAPTFDQLAEQAALLSGDLRGVVPLIEDEATQAALLRVADALDSFDGGTVSYSDLLEGARELVEKNVKGESRSHVLAVLFLVDASVRRWEAAQ